MAELQIGDKCVAAMQQCEIFSFDDDKGVWLRKLDDSGLVYESNSNRVFKCQKQLCTVTDSFKETMDLLTEQHGSMLDLDAVQRHLENMWIRACHAVQDENFFVINKVFDELENFVIGVGEACGNYAKCQVQGVYVLR